MGYTRCGLKEEKNSSWDELQKTASRKKGKPDRCGCKKEVEERQKRDGVVGQPGGAFVGDGTVAGEAPQWSLHPLRLIAFRPFPRYEVNPKSWTKIS